MPSPGGLLRRGLSFLPKRVQEPIRHAVLKTWAHLSEKLPPQMRWLEQTKSDERVRRLMDYPELAASPWKGLIAIAYGIVRKYQPRIVVELGTHSGCSAL